MPEPCSLICQMFTQLLVVHDDYFNKAFQTQNGVKIICISLYGYIQMHAPYVMYTAPD